LINTHVLVFDLVLVLVDGTGGALSDVFLDGESAEEDLGLSVAVGLGESVVGLGLLVGKGQLTERSMGLLTVELMGQLRQLYIKRAVKSLFRGHALIKVTFQKTVDSRPSKKTYWRRRGA
jgi:hypothetical protein